jgi:hypothetical protein
MRSDEPRLFVVLGALAARSRTGSYCSCPLIVTGRLCDFPQRGENNTTRNILCCRRTSFLTFFPTTKRLRGPQSSAMPSLLHEGGVSQILEEVGASVPTSAPVTVSAGSSAGALQAPAFVQRSIATAKRMESAAMWGAKGGEMFRAGAGLIMAGAAAHLIGRLWGAAFTAVEEVSNSHTSHILLPPPGSFSRGALCLLLLLFSLALLCMCMFLSLW